MKQKAMQQGHKRQYLRALDNAVKKEDLSKHQADKLRREYDKTENTTS
ncbi:hypothetical protein KA005_36380 [bacterium]|nr:hypothetical protein [bacterium]